MSAVTRDILLNVARHIADTGTCRNEVQHGEECWWLALDATQEAGDNPEHPTQEHQARAAEHQRKMCQRRPS